MKLLLIAFILLTPLLMILLAAVVFSALGCLLTIGTAILVLFLIIKVPMLGVPLGIVLLRFMISSGRRQSAK